MRILHTADWHLRAESPDRLRVLEVLRDVLDRESVDVLLIAGDLFDSPQAAHRLRPDLRRYFESLQRPVLLIPGNHDEEAFLEGIDLGQNVRLLGTEPVELEGVLFDGLWFRRSQRAVRELDRIQARWSGDAPVVLLAHVSFYQRTPRWHNRDLVEHEGLAPGQDCPLLAEDLADREIAYLALGHWHQYAATRAGLIPVVYPGTPVPLGESELGPRYVVLLEPTPSGPFSFRPLPLQGVPEIRSVRRFIWGDEAPALEQLEQLLAGGEPHVRLRVRLEGYLSGSEKAFRARLEALRGACADRWAEVMIDFTPRQVPDSLWPVLRALQELSPPAALGPSWWQAYLEEPLWRWVEELSGESIHRRALQYLVNALLEQA
jgi:exonuclease SbcD